MRTVVKLVISLSLLSSLGVGAGNAATPRVTVVPIGLTNFYVNSLVMDSKNNLYAGTAGGVFVRNVSLSLSATPNWTPINSGLTNTNVKVLAIYSTPSSEILYAGTWGGGVYSTGPIFNNPGIPNVAWVEKKFFGAPNTLPPNKFLNVTSLVLDASGNVYAGGLGSGVYKMGQNNTWTEFKSGLTNPIVTTLAKDASGNIYAGTYGGGVFKSATGAAGWIGLNTGLSNPLITTIALDSTGNYYYAGTIGGGIFKVTNWSLGWSPFANGLNNASIKAIAIDTSGNVYAGTESGVFKTPSWNASWAPYHPDLANPDATALLIDPSGNLYVGTAGGGVFRIPLTSWSNFN